MKPWKSTWKLPGSIPVNVPDGQSGPWSVSTFTVSKEDAAFSAMRAMISSDRGRSVPEGVYKALKRGNTMVMSNTPDEVEDCFDFFEAAKGRVLVNGLGLGMVLDVILNKVDQNGKFVVKEVTVVEKDYDVFKLVAPTFLNDKRVHIVIADAMTFKPEGRFDAVWHDIFDNICADNLPTMHKLHKKYGRRTAWQGSWCREQCEDLSGRWR